MNRKRWLLLAAALLVAVIAVWRFWPRGFDSMLKRPLEEAEEVSCYLQTLDREVIPGEESGPGDAFYQMEARTGEERQAILNILREGRCQPSFLNWLPWTKGSLSSGRGYDGRSMNLVIVFGGDEPAVSQITLFGGDKASVDGRQVVPIGNDMFDGLAAYIQAHGERVKAG
ncbi:MAG: hypothetical protein K2P33_09395 [Acutalibacter sp.]|nr:hypothetical protein [Acutalibacter sp.]